MEDVVHIENRPYHYSEMFDAVILYHYDQDRSKQLKPIGSAFLYLRGEHIFIVTAGHVLRGIEGHPVLAKIDKVIELGRSPFFIEESLDVAVIVCEISKIKKMFSNKIKMIVPIFSRGCLVSPMFQINGFPQSKNKMVRGKDNKKHMFRLTVGDEVDCTEIKLKIPKEFLYTMKIDLNKIVDDNGNVSVGLQRLQGMSGGALIGYETDPNSSDFRFGYLAGMFIEWYKREMIGVFVDIDIINFWLDNVIIPIVSDKGLQKF